MLASMITKRRSHCSLTLQHGRQQQPCIGHDRAPRLDHDVPAVQHRLERPANSPGSGTFCRRSAGNRRRYSVCAVRVRIGQLRQPHRVSVASIRINWLPICTWIPAMNRCGYAPRCREYRPAPRLDAELGPGVPGRDVAVRGWLDADPRSDGQPGGGRRQRLSRAISAWFSTRSSRTDTRAYSARRAFCPPPRNDPAGEFRRGACGRSPRR